MSDEKKANEHYVDVLAELIARHDKLCNERRDLEGFRFLMSRRYETTPMPLDHYVNEAAAALLAKQAECRKVRQTIVAVAEWCNVDKEGELRDYYDEHTFERIFHGNNIGNALNTFRLLRDELMPQVERAMNDSFRFGPSAVLDFMVRRMLEAEARGVFYHEPADLTASIDKLCAALSPPPNEEDDDDDAQ